MTDKLDYYRRVIKGERVPITAEDPQYGYYRYMKRDAVAIYGDKETGELVVSLNGKPLPNKTEKDKEFIQNVWVGSANKPIDPDVYKMRINTQLWPEEKAKIENSDSVVKNLAAMDDLASKQVLAMADRKKKREGDDIGIISQSEADTAAGFVQQIRALLSDSDETIKLMTQPYDDAIKQIKSNFIDPVASLKQMQEFFLTRLTQYGKKMKREANDPDFKFAAGKAGDGKTIALKRVEALEIEDVAKLTKHFKNNEDLKVALKEATDAVLLKFAVTAYKAEKTPPPGTKVVEDFKAV